MYFVCFLILFIVNQVIVTSVNSKLGCLNTSQLAVCILNINKHKVPLNHSSGFVFEKADSFLDNDTCARETLITTFYHSRTNQRYLSDKDEATLDWNRTNIVTDQSYSTESLKRALRIFDKILEADPISHQGRCGRARVLDLLAERKKSVTLLEECIKEYELVLSLPGLSDELYIKTSNRLIDRTNFRGWYDQSLKVQQYLVHKYPNDFRFLEALIHTTANNENSQKFLKNVLKSKPNSGFVSVYYGLILKSQFDLVNAVAYLKRGITSGEPGTENNLIYYELGEALQRLNRSEEAYNLYEEGIRKGLFKSKWQRPRLSIAGLTARPWWAMSQIKFSKQLKLIENEWLTIREEGLALLDLDKKNVILKEDERELQRKLTIKGSRRKLKIFAGGKKNIENCAKVPKTCAIIERFKESVTCLTCQVAFSIIDNGTKLQSHCGPTNARLRGHLGLVVPPEAWIRVANETRTWPEGKFIIFDDSFEHEVGYEAPGYRMVLIIDFWHPDLKEEQINFMLN